MDHAELNQSAGQSGALSQPIHGDAMDDVIEIDLFQLLYHLLERAKWIAVITLLGVVITGIITWFVITPMYTATSKLYVLSTDDTAINLSDFQIGTYLTADYQEVFSNWHVHERVIQKLNLPYNYTEISDMLEISNPTDTRILYITVTAENPDEAKLIADTYASVAQEFIASTMDTKKPNLFEEALLPTAPSSPRFFLTITISFFACMLLACGIFTVEFILDDRIHSSDDLEKYFGISTFGLLPIQEKQMVVVDKKQQKDKGASA